MKKTISFLVIAAIFVCLLSALTGCKMETAETVYFLNFKPESAAAYEEIAKVYKEEKGVDVKVVTAASGTYEQTLKTPPFTKLLPIKNLPLPKVTAFTEFLTLWKATELFTTPKFWINILLLITKKLSLIRLTI